MVLDVLTRLFKPQTSIPVEYRNNFIHLFGDIAWYGVLNGSTVQFLSVYAARIGATGEQVGLLGAAAAFANLIFSLPVLILFSKGSISKSVLWSAILNRFFYAVFIIIPSIFVPRDQVWAIIGLSFLMSFPLTGILVGFNALFGDAVPVSWRAYVTAVRNALVALMSLITTISCGFILDSVPQPLGYQIVFFIGFIGAVMSTYHLSRIQTFDSQSAGKPEGGMRTLANGISSLLRFDVIKTHYKRIITIFFFFHLFQFLVIPIFPIYAVNILKYSDQHISWGFSCFQALLFIVSTQLFRFTRRWSNRIVLGIGMVLMGEFPLFLPLSTELWVFILVVSSSSIGWGLVSGTMFNYLLEKMPDNDRPAYMSWYNLANNAAVLLGSLLGPAISLLIGFEAALFLFAIGRIAIGVVILLKG